MVVVASRRAAHNRDRLAAVLRTVERNIRDINYIGILRINRNAAEVPGTAGQTRIGILQRPGIASVIGSVEPGLLRINQRINSLAVRRYRNPRASPFAIRQPGPVQPRPRFAAIHRPVQPATRPAERSIRAPRRTACPPHGGIENTGIIAGDRQVRRANVRPFFEYLCPVLTAIACFIDATFRIGGIGVAEHRYKSNARIMRIHDNSADLPGLAQPNIFPSLSSVHRFINTVSGR